MLAVKLKNSIEIPFSTSASPFDEPKKINADSIAIRILEYELNGETLVMEVRFIKSEKLEEPVDSSISDDLYEYSIVRTFNEVLKKDEFSSWGESDETLLEIILSKYNLEADSFFDIKYFS
jgi:hypothetical protein